jgi:hypothetical protein
MAVPLRPGRIVQKDVDIQEYTDPDNDPMIPHTLVLKPGLVVHKIYNGYWFWGRPSFVDLWQVLRDVTREIRPDWDLSAPGCVRPGKRATDRRRSAAGFLTEHESTLAPEVNRVCVFASPACRNAHSSG